MQIHSQFLSYILVNMVPKQSDIEGSVSLPQEVKDANSVQQFKNKIKIWKNVDCDCKLCKQYITPARLFIILYTLKILLIYLVDFIPFINTFFDLCNFIDCYSYLFCCMYCKIILLA